MTIRIMFILLIVFAVFSLTTTALCGPAKKAAPKPLPPDTNKLDPDHVPTPFSADQIRDTCKNGRRITFLVEVPGKAPMLQIFNFVGGDEAKAKLETSNHDIKGKLIGEKQVSEPTWKELQAHASFPAATTNIRSDNIMTNPGKFDSWFYTVLTEKDGKKIETYYWFAKDLPGPPILVRKKIDGRIALTLTMVRTGMEKPKEPKKTTEETKSLEKKPSEE